MARLALVLVVLAGHVALFARSARAEDVVLVIDRGAGAKDGAVENHRTAQQLAERLHERGDTFKAYAVGARPNGKPRVVEVKAHLSELDGQEGLAYEGPTDVRVALAAALRGPAPKAPLTVVLIGAFGRVDPSPEGASTAVDAWNRAAPEGSRVIPFGLSEPAQKALEKAKGWRPQGRVVLRLGRASVETEPWSAFATTLPLRAAVRATVEVAGLLDVGDGAAVVLELAATGTDGDTFRDDGHGGLVLERLRVAGFETSVTLGITGDGVAWDLSGPHAPIAVRWTPNSEVVWQSGHPTLRAGQLERGVPEKKVFKYRRTRPPDAFHMVTTEHGPAPDFPVRLRLDVEPERDGGLPFVVEGAVTLTAEYVGPAPIDQLAAPGPFVPSRQEHFDDSLRSYFLLRSQPGRARARLTAPTEARALPPASTDEPWSVDVVAENRNVPERVNLVWTPEPHEAAASLTLFARQSGEEESVWPADEVRAVKVGTPLRLRLAGADGGFPPMPGTVRLHAPEVPGLAVTVEGEGTWRPRRPRLLVEPGEVRYRADAKDPAEERPLRLRLDADGGDGPWLAALQARTPELEQARGSRQSFTVTTLSPGRWEVRRGGAWSGARGDIFTDREERLALAIRWHEREAPVKTDVPLTVPARWGRMGWLLLGLAGLAVLLGLFVVLSHRALPLEGTLLYVVEGRAGAVGRLPLAPAGRRTTTVTADERGRLALGGDGTPLLRLLPTRVGGMAEVPVEGGGHERRLLVDGLSFSVGRHALRYVQTGGREPVPETGEASSPPTTSAPDLLGPEYDLPHGS